MNMHTHERTHACMHARTHACTHAHTHARRHTLSYITQVSPKQTHTLQCLTGNSYVSMRCIWSQKTQWNDITSGGKLLQSAKHLHIYISIVTRADMNFISAYCLYKTPTKHSMNTHWYTLQWQHQIQDTLTLFLPIICGDSIRITNILHVIKGGLTKTLSIEITVIAPDRLLSAESSAILKSS